LNAELVACRTSSLRSPRQSPSKAINYRALVGKTYGRRRRAKRTTPDCTDFSGQIGNAEKKQRADCAAGGLDNPSGQFREFAAECLELAQTTLSLEKRSLYLEMARVWFQMAVRWEKRLQRDRPS